MEKTFQSPKPHSSKGHVFAHAMWRTGSTAIARCFLASDNYLVFYEPFHESCGSLTRINQMRQGQSRQTQELRHPAWTGGYFDTYLLKDPLTGKPLWTLFDRSSTLSTTYRTRPHPRALAYLDACKRVAEDQGKRAFFGFCRSGQHAQGIPIGPDESGFYLYRDPHSQFLSYDWPKNEYFLPCTLIQLLSSKATRKVVLGLLPNDTSRVRLFTFLMRRPSFERQIALGRTLAKQLTPRAAYQMFYLSHCITLHAARQAGLPCVTMDDFNLRRAEIQAQYGVDFTLLRPTRPAHDDVDQFDAWEKELQERFGAQIPALSITFHSKA
ncbi:MAG: hypothetical protein KJ731_12955 [Alphaproteobacteria bacterium]|nr:hypothetical protein [Alphaproteobacteria bacterium]MBU1280930.1 hypothetical protein [Alphaproteobacteria bacterium]MBU1574100.1 hypothetical protein [Alphaproteobacteria bacterium]MBU1829363.1 hypothetical protein [Alphaproteobacteria bacterium]MBU2079635.1 hypothetical protein [Alphaproteobacteria bacterium]